MPALDGQGRFRMLTKTFRSSVALVAVAAVLSACSSTRAPRQLDDRPIAVRTPDINRTAGEAVNFFREKPIIVLETGGSNTFSLEMDRGDAIPDVMIGEINAAPMKFGALLAQVAEEAGLSWRISGKDMDLLMEKEVFFVQRSPAPLRVVLEEISQITQSFYAMNGDRIIFSQDQLFVARVPRMADSQDILATGLENIGATEIFKDVLSGTVTFRGTRPVYEAAQRLMASLEAGRDMVVYDFWIIDRSLTDSTGVGTDLGASRARNSGGSGGSGSEGGGGEEGARDFIGVNGSGLASAIAAGNPTGVMLSGNLGSFDLDATLRFLRSLGDTETVARPTISMLSGATSGFQSGEKSQYIKEVNSSANESTTSTGTQVETLETGVKIEVTGAHNAGVISTRFKVDVSELLAFEEFDTGEVQLRLPKTSQRVLEANIEARPGDVMILGGIIRDRQELASSKIPGVGATLGRSSSATKTETIILVRPRLVQIRPNPASRGQSAAHIEAGVGEIRRAPNPVAGVIEDEARARRALSGLK